MSAPTLFGCVGVAFEASSINAKCLAISSAGTLTSVTIAPL
jgi:hypothetical protein